MSINSETRAFPATLQADASAVFEALHDGARHSARHPPVARVLVQGETIEMPTRLYHLPADLLACAGRPGTQGLIALCLGTRHHDGHLRQACLERIIGSDEAWVVPFVVQLVGEYVLPILQSIERSLPGLNAPQYAEFLCANAAHHATIRRRVVSYWNAHYRGDYPLWAAYPGYRVLAALSAISGSAEPSLPQIAAGWSVLRQAPQLG